MVFQSNSIAIKFPVIETEKNLTNERVCDQGDEPSQETSSTIEVGYAMSNDSGNIAVCSCTIIMSTYSSFLQTTYYRSASMKRGYLEGKLALYYEGRQAVVTQLSRAHSAFHVHVRNTGQYDSDAQSPVVSVPACEEFQMEADSDVDLEYDDNSEV